MRILHLSSATSWRGGEQQIAYLIEELQKMGVECLVACRKESVFEEHCRKNQIPHKSFPFRNTMDFSTSWQVKKYANQEGVDLIHAHTSITHSIAVWAHLLGAKPGIIVSRRIDNPIKKKWLTLFKYRYTGVKRIVCVSHLIEKVVNQTIQKPEKTLTVHSGIDLQKFEVEPASISLKEEFNMPIEHLLIGNASALAGHKDYPTFIAVAEKLLQKGLEATFVIIGDGEEKEKLHQLVAEKCLEGKIIFTGFRKDIPQLLPQLDLFLFTSETEGLGTTLLDAIACKVPVVATRAGGAPEVIIHEKTGLSCEVKDVQCLTDQVEKMVSDETLRTTLVANASKHLKNFTKENTAKKTLDIYKEVIG